LPIFDVVVGFGDVAIGFNLWFWRRQFRHFLRHQLVHTLDKKQDNFIYLK